MGESKNMQETLQNIGTLNSDVDARWANQFTDSTALNSYFDYFFTGQDIQCYIEGIEKPDKDAELPVMALAFDIEQQKVPVFGFWNYTHSNVMRGTRIVSGVLNLYTTSTDYMTRMLSKAATARQTAASKAARNKDYINTLHTIRGLDIDEANIEKYWGRNINADLSPYGDNKSIFSAHPPFNLIVVYGLQSSSVTSSGDARTSQVVANYRELNTPILTDTNERLVATEEDNAMRIVIENIEITKMHVEYQPDGSPLMESYSFFARDIITPKIDLGASHKRETRTIN